MTTRSHGNRRVAIMIFVPAESHASSVEMVALILKSSRRLNSAT